MTTQTRTWLDFALQQMVAEAYLPPLPATEAQITAALKLGNNNPNQGFDPNAANLRGKTRFTDQQITYFTSNWEIVDHRSNDDSRFANIGIGNGTGFSATLLRNKTTGEYTFSFRSTEFADEAAHPATKGSGLEISVLGLRNQ